MFAPLAAASRWRGYIVIMTGLAILLVWLSVRVFEAQAWRRGQVIDVTDYQPGTV